MKTQKFILSTVLVIALMWLSFSCSQDKVDPALVLDEVFVPEGYHQTDNPPADALARLEELRLENPDDHYYYLKREDLTTKQWLFSQKELKIESVTYPDVKTITDKTNPLGVIVKKIKGDYRDEEFTVMEKQPSPKDGMKAFYEYIGENLKYPAEAKKEGVEGKVFVQFVVDKNGKLTEVMAVKGIGAGCDEEAVRVLNEAPNWNPGMVVDMPVKVRMILPINYKLN